MAAVGAAFAPAPAAGALTGRRALGARPTSLARRRPRPAAAAAAAGATAVVATPRPSTGGSPPPAATTTAAAGGSVVSPIVGEAAFRAAIRAPAADGGLVVTAYVAPHCRSCAAMKRRVDRLAEAYGGRDVHFFALDVTEPANAGVVAAARVEALPTFHLSTVLGGEPGHLDTMVVAPREAHRLADRVALYTSGSFDVREFAFE